MKWPWTHFRHIPKWYPAAFERLPDVLACELTVTGWTGRIDWAQMDYVARSLSLEELAESIKRWGESSPQASGQYLWQAQRIVGLLKSIQSERGAGTPAAVESRAGGST